MVFEANISVALRSEMGPLAPLRRLLRPSFRGCYPGISKGAEPPRPCGYMALRRQGRSAQPHGRGRAWPRGRSGDVEVRRRFVENYLRLAVCVAREYRGRGLPFEYLIQERNIGLMNAGIF